jgi:release factor glutamine methyltransferase
MLDAAASTSAAEALAWARERLRAAGVEDAPRDARLLLAAALGVEAGHRPVLPSRPLAPAEAVRFRRLIAARAARCPVSRLLGRRGFWDIELAIDDAVLDPRPETETLVEAVLDRLSDPAAPLRLLDFGTGSGCLLLALLASLPAARGVGVDRSLAALACARANAGRLGLAGRADFLVGDWGCALAGGFDIIVANPPYIVTAEIDGLAPEVHRFEPRSALDGGADGLACYRTLVPDLARLLAPGGIGAIECGIGQAMAVATLLRNVGLDDVTTRNDLGGIPRCLVFTCCEGDGKSQKKAWTFGSQGLVSIAGSRLAS